MKFKWIYMIISVVIIISGCSDDASSAGDCPASEASIIEDERNENYMNNDKPVQQNSLPPLDQEIPRDLETATLAMG